MYFMRRKFRFVLLWAIIASLWIIVVSILFAVYIFGPKVFQTTDILIIDISAIFIGIPLFFASIFVLPYSWNGAAKIEKFMTDFHPIWVKMQVEAENIVGGRDIEKLHRIVNTLIPKYKNYKPSSKMGKKVKASLSGFEIVVHDRRKLGLVKVTSEGQLYDKNSILDLEKTVISLANKLRCKVGFLALVQNEFADELLDWDEDVDILIKRGALLLFLENAEDGLRPKWVSPPNKRPLLN